MTHAWPIDQHDVTYYTVSEENFFLGTVMLINSLRVTGNHGKVVVLDAGLTAEQRALLERHAEVVRLPPTERNAAIPKPFVSRLNPSGTVVIVDSDIVVTARLDDALDLAREGKIVAEPAWVPAIRRRWFAEWEKTLRLRAPLRREEWFHNGLVVLSIDHWPQLLERWSDVTDLVPPEQAFRDGPFSAPDADCLNALLMSEIPRSALALLSEGDEAFGGDVVVEDVRALRCTLNGRPTRVLHYPDKPKPWQPRGWTRAGVTSYARIMRRLLFAPDVPIRVEPATAPLWLRAGPKGRAAWGAAAVAYWTVVWPSLHLPERARNRVRGWRRRTVARRGRANMPSTAALKALEAARVHASPSTWRWTAAVAACVSALGLVLQTALDHVPAPPMSDLAAFWSVLAAAFQRLVPVRRAARRRRGRRRR